MRPGYIARCDVYGKRQQGAAAVEFALVIIILILIVAGIIEFGRAFWHYNALVKAARDGARYMTTAHNDTISSTAVPAAQALVVNAANAASISPALAAGNVSVTCLDDAFQTVTCQDGTVPANVKVAITGYSFTIGGWVGFVLPSNGVATFTPHTTMRYMCISSSGTSCY